MLKPTEFKEANDYMIKQVIKRVNSNRLAASETTTNSPFSKKELLKAVEDISKRLSVTKQQSLSELVKKEFSAKTNQITAK